MAIVLPVIMVISFCCPAQKFNLSDSTFSEGSKLITYEVLFVFVKGELSELSYPFLDSLAAFMKTNENLSFEIGVHCDERNSDNMSTILTMHRAKSIRNYLADKGVSSERLKPMGYENTDPLIKGAKTEEEHQKNRRVEIKIIAIKSE